MQKIVLLIIFFISVKSYGQIEIPFFEQIAFDFYKESIAGKSQFRKKIKVAKYTVDIHPEIVTFQVHECLEGKTLSEGKELEIFQIYALEQMDFDSPTHSINYEESDKEKFRIKNTNNYGFPRIKISIPYSKIDDYKNFYVNIIEEIDRKNSITYYLKIDDKGTILNWCKNKTELVTIK